MVEILPPESVLIGHGFHSDEPAVKELYEALARRSPSNLENTILSPEEWESGTRLVDGENLSIVLPDSAGTRAQRILAGYAEKAKKYDVAIHPHGIRVPGSELAIYGAASSPLVKSVASYFGLSRAIIRTQGIEAILSNTLSIEIGSDVDSILSVPIVYGKLLSMARDLPPVPTPIEEYAYVADVSTETARKLGLRMRYDTLEPLTRSDTNALNNLLGQKSLELFAYAWDGALFDDRVGFRGELVSHHPLPSAVPFYGSI